MSYLIETGPSNRNYRRMIYAALNLNPFDANGQRGYWLAYEGYVLNAAQPDSIRLYEWFSPTDMQSAATDHALAESEHYA